MQRALRGEATYMNHTFGVVDPPRYDSIDQGPDDRQRLGPLTEWGRRRRRDPAQRQMTASALLPPSATTCRRSHPWYPEDKHGGFTLTSRAPARGPAMDRRADRSHRRPRRTNEAS